MKKFTLFAVAALMVAVSALAQPKGKLQTRANHVSKAAQAKAPERPVLKVTEIAQSEVGKVHQLARANKQASRLMQSNDQRKPATLTMQQRQRKAAKPALRRAAGIIIDQPEGTYHNMKYASSYFGYSLFGQYNGVYDEALGEVVEGTDGCLYIHNLLTEFSTEEGYWVKAEKVEGVADTYVIHEQPIYVEDYYGTLYTYYIMKVVYNSAQSAMLPATNTDITFTWKNGVLRTAKEFNNAQFTTAISAYDDSNYWSGAMNWNITMTAQTAKAITELPDGAVAEKMVGKYVSKVDEEGTPTYTSFQAWVAVSGSDMYLQFIDAADGWVKGTINGDKVTFASGQYMGPSTAYGQHLYFLAATEDEEGNFMLHDNAVFEYDAATQTLKNSGVEIIINAGMSRVYYVARYDNPEIFKFVDLARTPQAPTDNNAMNYNPTYGYGYYDFTIPEFDAEGNYLDANQMYYKVYVGDDESNTVFTFTPDEYAELTEAMTEVPATLSGDNFWTSGSSHEFVLYCNMSKNFGVQAIYKGGGETHASEISWYGLNNGAAGYESVFPSVKDPEVNSPLAEGQMAVNLGEPSYGYGTSATTTEHYDVAMKVDDFNSGAKISGKKVVGVSVPFLSTTGISDCKVWLSTSIALNADGTFTPDGPVKEFTLSENGYTTVMFDEPFEIPAYDEATDKGGLFIGYSFTQAYDPEATESAKPVVLTGYSNVGGFMIYTDKVFRYGWASMEGNEGDLALEAIITGCDANAAEISNIADVYQKVGDENITAVTISNYGYKGLDNADFDYLLLNGDVELRGTNRLSTLNLKPVFGAYTTEPIRIPSAPVSGDYIYYADVTKANGEANAIQDIEAQCNVFVKDFMPTKRPLLEEYTGTWCGYCPRGYVALEKMAELYPDDFVALSYHNGDPMEFTYEYPSEVSGFPAAWMDRSMEVDAYHGATNDDFGIEQTWKERCNDYGVADIDVEASWSDDMKTINVKSTTTFAGNEEYASYTIGYAVVADGLTGTGSDWAQSNYYADQSMGTPKYMEQFYNGESHVSGLVFNDVIVATAPYEGVEGSLPETIVAGTPYTHTYSFDASQIVNTAGEPIIQDKNKVKVVAMLLEWGAVKNANKCKVTTVADGISELSGAAQKSVKTEYFDLSGRRVLIPSNGVYVKSVQYKDGRTATQKVVVK